jgi:hypothetical protein
MELEMLLLENKFEDTMESFIVIYQIVAHVLAYFYLYGSYMSFIDLDLVVVCVILLARKIILKKWIYYQQFHRSLAAKLYEIERNENLKA